MIKQITEKIKENAEKFNTQKNFQLRNDILNDLLSICRNSSHIIGINIENFHTIGDFINIDQDYIFIYALDKQGDWLVVKKIKISKITNIIIIKGLKGKEYISIKVRKEDQ